MSFLRVLFLLAFFFFKGFTCFVSSCSGHPQSILRSKRWNREHRDEFSFNDRGNEVRWHLKALSPKNGWRQRDGAATLRFYNNHQKVTFVQLVQGGSQVTECSQRSKPSKQTIAAITGLNIVLAAVLYFNLFASSLSKAKKGPAEISFFVTALVCTLLTSTANWGVFELLWEKNKAEKTKEMAEFSRFQLQYLSVHLISAFTDFMQGAYLYKIYEMSGYTMQETAFLYLFGFLSSLVFGFSAGRAVDARGRRAGALAHLTLNAAQCLLLVWGARAPRRWGWPALVLGRALSGVATSLLMTSYECWMVAEHNRRGFAPELLSNTFTRYTFGMGAMAVLSGFVAGGLVKGGFGVDSPFSFCAGVSLANLALAAATWPENRGTDTLPVGNASAAAALHKSAPPRQRIAKPAAAAAALLGGPTAAPRRRGSAGGGSRAPLWVALRSPRVLLVGFVQAVFEAALMAFIFLWTPVLDAATKAAPLNHGFVFSTFMVAVMAGSSAFQLVLAAAGDGGGGGGAEEMVLLGALGESLVTAYSLFLSS